ncbi:MAG: hypothetical protein JW837_18555 [Sedimentisphaerales bacterium]|nr:hypothetical protein [Sedimentisphaerales bacterium]
MKISGIIHQHICQLKWHLLACIGLIMVLPVEEAMVSFRAGDGFCSESMVYAAIAIGPLLAGLIACANVQEDLNDKRYIFWRSKPANINLLITLKFFIGLAVSLFVIACPLVFHIVTNIVWNWESVDRTFLDYYILLPFVLIAIMTYSLCFASNVLVRNTARSWLIGMLTGCFLIIIPFILPLHYTDFITDIMHLTFGLIFAIALVVSAAFVFALFAAKYDWHLKTNLKSLLWVVAGLAFALFMLFSSQVANIKILQEKEIKFSPEFDYEWSLIENAGEKLIFQGRSYIQIEKDDISFISISEVPGYGILYMPREEGYQREWYPEYSQLYKNVGDNLYYFVIHAYYRREGEGTSVKHFFEKAYLRSYKHTDKSWRPICELDISDCLGEKRNIRMAMRLIDNKLIACVNNSFILLDATNPEELKIIDKKIDVLKRYLPFTYENREEEFSIPLVPIEEISMEERIRLSIDLNYGFNDRDNKIYKSSIVDVHDDKFAFFFKDYSDDIARFDVTGWDEENIHCKFSGARPFTILETLIAPNHYHYVNIVKDGKLYCYNYNEATLMVFDVRSKSKIRKLGHFVHMNYHIKDVAVLENGNILACMRWDADDYDTDIPTEKGRKYYLFLLKNPE